MKNRNSNFTYIYHVFNYVFFYFSCKAQERKRIRPISHKNYNMMGISGLIHAISAQFNAPRIINNKALNRIGCCEWGYNPTPYLASTFSIYNQIYGNKYL